MRMAERWRNVVDDILASAWSGRFAALAILALTGWWVAGVAWRWAMLAPAPAASRTEAHPAHVARAIKARHPFGIASATGVATTTVQSHAATRIQVVGVVASSRTETAGAILAVGEQRPRFVHLGEEIGGGQTLAAVMTGAVEIESGGRRQRLELQVKRVVSGKSTP